MKLTVSVNSKFPKARNIISDVLYMHAT